MKTIKIFLKPISYFFAFVIPLQGCVIYNRKPSSLEEAVKANTKVRIETKDQQMLRFKRIEFKNGEYLGINETLKIQKEVNPSTGLVERKKVMEKLETPLEKNRIEKLLVKNKTMSTIMTISIPTTPILAYVIAVAFFY